MERRLHAAENMDSFEKGWTLREVPNDGNARLKAEKLDDNPENNTKGALLGTMITSSQGGFLPSIGGSASARSSSAQLKPYPPSGSQSARGAGKVSLPKLGSATHPGPAAQQRERLARQRKTDAEVFRKAFAVIDKDGSGQIEPDEIVSCLKIFGKDVDKKRFWQVFKEADRDKSDSLNVDEFVVMMMNVTEKTRAAKAKRANALSRRLKGGAARIAKEQMQAKEREKYRGGRREQKKVEEGSAWMDQALSQHRGLADIYAARRRLQRKALGVGLIEPEEDPRMRTMLGRRVIQEEKRAAAEEQRKIAQPHVGMAALDTFATMFGKAPETTPAPAPAPAPVAESDADEDSD